MSGASDPGRLSIVEIGRLIRTREISPVDLASYYLDRIAKLDELVGSYVAVQEDKIMRAARRAEREIAGGKHLGPLHGIPIAVKENIAVKNERTAAGTKILADYMPDHDANCVARLRAAGAIMMGRTNMHEWAKGSTTDNPFFGATRNPWNLERIPGGSSGGSAAAVAAAFCAAALGTDNAGSVRQPAAFCGIVGLKPTFGRVSHHGVVCGTGAPSTDHIGILSKTVEDSALILNEIAGFDALDPLSSREPVPNFRSLIGRSVRGMKVALLKEYFFDTTSKEVRDSVEDALAVFKGLGMVETEITISHLKYLGMVRTGLSAESILGHEEYLRSRPRDYSPSVLHMMIQGLLEPAVYFVRASHIRGMIAEEIEDALQHVDVIITPTISIPAPKLSDCRKGVVRIDGGKVSLTDLRKAAGSLFVRHTFPFNLTGHPTLSLPCGLSHDNLPIGFQVTTSYYNESKLFQIADAYEKATNWCARSPQPLA